MAKEIDIAVLKEQALNNIKDHKEIKELICELKQDFKEFKVDADNRYAPKWVATLVYALVAGAGLYILQSILRTVGLE